MKKVNKIKQIFEGWRNYISPKKEEAVTIMVVSEKRMNICYSCPYHSRHNTKYFGAQQLYIKVLNFIKYFYLCAYCIQCGCPLVSKTKCMSCECPVGKWQSVDVKEENNDGE